MENDNLVIFSSLACISINGCDPVYEGQRINLLTYDDCRYRGVYFKNALVLSISSASAIIRIECNGNTYPINVQHIKEMEYVERRSRKVCGM